MANASVAIPTRCLHVLQLVMGLITTLLYNVVRSTLLLVMRKPKSLKGYVAVVTGAGEDLGRELACQLNEEGCLIICVDKDVNQCKETASFINERNNERGINRKAYSYNCDVSDQYEVVKLAQQIHKQHGRVDILINNASRPNAQQHMIDLISNSLSSHFWIILAFLPGMLKRHRGHIVSMLPAATVTGSKATQSAEKAAVQGLLDKLAQELELEAKFIKLTNVQPYIVDSAESLRIPELLAARAAQDIVHAVKYELCSILTPQNAFIWQSAINLPEDTSNVWREAFSSRRLQDTDSLPPWGSP